MADIEKFDPSKLMDGVKDRIKATFVGLIPDDAWEAMVKKEIDAFFQPVTVTHSQKMTTRNYYSEANLYKDSVTQESPFRTIVWQFCAEKVTKIMNERMDNDFFGGKWGSDILSDEQLKKKVEEVAANAAPAAVENFFKRMTASVVEQLSNRNY